MAENRDRRDLLRDAAIEVLAEQGGRGLTHRAVDQRAGLPEGTAKNYFASRDALLQAAAERCVERYWADLRHAQSISVDGRDGLVALLAELVERARTVNRSRVLAYVELHAEAARRPRVRETLAELTQADLALHLESQRAAGLPATRSAAAMVTMCVNTALTYLLTQSPETLKAYGLDDVPAFLRGLIDTAYPAAAT
ncbi:TetR family transcriptional regulator [Nonomuraea sp. NN258]|uniref:TetR/AcrR family transcriptional regulator n=1 Tax=Nonomuraea antri TaxID=2730852 RepID=UPI001568DF42|nr:TetR family transcriptional regulator [Nonomuraea antri]NRQ34968.1 TetR family transcriptional regulator [Nonomuraea antri]